MSSQYQYYLSNEVLYYRYRQIIAQGSPERDVGYFYGDMLLNYFPPSLGYGIELEHRNFQKLGVSSRRDFTIHCIRNIRNDITKVIIHEYKKGMETSSTAWTDALAQVTTYARIVRQEEGQNPNETLYLIVAIGTDVRFYQLDGRFTVATDFARTGGKVYELSVNEQLIHRLFLELQRLTSRGPSTTHRGNTMGGGKKNTWWARLRRRFGKCRI